MKYFISGHRNLTYKEFQEFYEPAIIAAIEDCLENYEECEFLVGDCKGCDEMAANFIAKYILENTDDVDEPPCSLHIYHMFSEPRFRIGVLGIDKDYHIDILEDLNSDLCDDDLYTIEECPTVHYVGGYESDTDRDSAMTRHSDKDIAYVRDTASWKSGTAQNVLRRITMKRIKPSLYEE